MSKLCKEATLTRTQIQSDPAKTPSLCEFLTRVNRETGSSVQGLAFATNGTWPVLGCDKCSSAETPKLSITPIDGRHFEPTKVYELRLWIPVKLPDEPAEGDVLAREYRWVNGVGAVELRVTAGTDGSQTNGSKGSGDRGWVRAVQYLEHVPSSRSTAKHVPASPDKKSDQSGGGTTTSHMTALEFIQEEDKYGNTVVTDQLFTGRWK
jgi:hypothetical protein